MSEVFSWLLFKLCSPESPGDLEESGGEPVAVEGRQAEVDGLALPYGLVRPVRRALALDQPQVGVDVGAELPWHVRELTMT